MRVPRARGRRGPGPAFAGRSSVTAWSNVRTSTPAAGGCSPSPTCSPCCAWPGCRCSSGCCWAHGPTSGRSSCWRWAGSATGPTASSPGCSTSTAGWGSCSTPPPTASTSWPRSSASGCAASCRGGRSRCSSAATSCSRCASRCCAAAATAPHRWSTSARRPLSCCCGRSRCCWRVCRPAGSPICAVPTGYAFAIWGSALYLYTGALYLAQISLALRAPRTSVDRAPG